MQFADELSLAAAMGHLHYRATLWCRLRIIVLDHTIYANERDHVQKIVEQHYWLFGEQHHLVTADKRMQ